jgi:hypothetical protein
METLILTTPDELRAMIHEAVAGAMPKAAHEEMPDSITLLDAVELLHRHGYPTSKAQIYKLTSSGGIPCRRYGHKLVFSRKELLQWAESQTKPKHDDSVMLNLARSARRKKPTR